MKVSVKKAFRISEGVDDGDKGAALDAIGELEGIAESYNNGEYASSSELGRELVSWFKTNVDTIFAALGIEMAKDEAKKPPLGSGDRFRNLTNQLANEGKPKAKEVDKSQEDDAEDKSNDSQLPDDVTQQIRDLIDALERIVPDENPEGDEADTVLDDEPIGDVEEEAHDPAALAAWIGREKYGNKRFQKLAISGKRRSNH